MLPGESQALGVKWEDGKRKGKGLNGNHAQALRSAAKRTVSTSCMSLGIDVRRIDAMLTLPNAINTAARNALRNLGEEGLREILTQVLKNMKELLRAHPGAVPTVHAQQRRWPSMRAVPYHDAVIRFDLRTAVPGYGKAALQPAWLMAAYGAFADNRGANYELPIGVDFPYGRCPGLAEPSAVEMIEEAWLACKPLVDIVR